MTSVCTVSCSRGYCSCVHVLFFLWLDLVSVGCGRYSESMVMKFVKRFKSSFFTALLECWPGKRVDDGVDAGCLVVSICNPSCCTALDFF